MTDVIRFVIFAAPRTGSNWVCSLLDSHPDILCHHEIFNQERILSAVSCRDAPIDFGSVAARDRDPMRVYEAIWQHSRGARALGFKINRGQAPDIAKHVIHAPAVRKLILRRGNRVRTFVSEKIALATGIWESYRWSATRLKPLQIKLDASELIAHVAENEAYFAGITAQLEATGQRYLNLDYEALMASRTLARGLEPALGFLGQRVDVTLTGATSRQNPQPLRELIANFDALAGRLRVEAPLLHAELLEASTNSAPSVMQPVEGAFE